MTEPDFQPQGVVAVVYESGRLLVIRRSAEVVAPRKVCFPGGWIRPGEDEPTALVREIDEELGIPIIPQQRLWQSVTPWNVSLAWWVARRVGEVAFHPTPHEVESVHWATREELEAEPDLLESNRQFLAAWHEGVFQLQSRES